MASLPTGFDISLIFEKYMNSARTLVSSLHNKFTVGYSVMPAHKTRKIDPKGERWLAKHPEHLQKGADGFAVSKALSPRKHITFDTVENRFLKYILNSTVKQLESFKKTHLGSADNIDELVVNKTDDMISDIKRLISASFLKNVNEYKHVQGITAAIEMAPCCRELYNHHLMLVRALSIGADAFKTFPRMPMDLEKRLLEVDWSMQDVLVGSVASREQFKDNYKRRYYYVPAAYIDGKSPVRYVALYQSTKMFGKEAGIRYYGEVVVSKRLRRREINFPSRHGNGDAIYYAFLVNEWKRLPKEIQVKDEGVYGPRFTNLFLLQNCSQSYELFSITSEEQYRLLHSLKQIFSDAVKVKSEGDFKVGNKTVRIRDGGVDIFNENMERVLDHTIKISEFYRRPRYYFNLMV